MTCLAFRAPRRMRTRITTLIAVLALACGSVPFGGAWAGPAAAERLRLGVVPAETTVRTLRQYQPIADYLDARLARGVTLQPQPDYRTVLERLGRGRLDAAIMGSFICYRAITEFGAVPVARPEADGDSTYEGVVFARRDSGAGTLEDLRGRRFVSADAQTSAGYLYPRALLRRADHDPDRFFSEVVFAGRHDGAVLMVAAGWAPAGAAKDDVFDRLRQDNPQVARELVVLHRSDARFPDRTVAVRPGLSAGVTARFRAALLGMHEDEAGRKALAAAGFDRYIATHRADFMAVREMLP